MRLIITRHGETKANKEGILEGRAPGKLTAEGRNQIKKLAERLKTQSLDHIYSSNLLRAAETAEEIAQHHTAPVTFAEELRESELGPWEGLPMSRADWNNTPEGVESNESIQQRTKIFLEKIIKKHANQTVLLVAHNGVNKALMRNLLEKEPYCPISFKQHYTAITVFDIKKTTALLLFNCTRHLEQNAIGF